MKNVKKIEVFLNKLCFKYGKDVNSPQEPLVSKVKDLMEVVKEVSYKKGDECVNDFFIEVLETLVSEAQDLKMKEMYLSTLNEFKKEITFYLN